MTQDYRDPVPGAGLEPARLAAAAFKAAVSAVPPPGPVRESFTVTGRATAVHTGLPVRVTVLRVTTPPQTDDEATIAGDPTKVRRFPTHTAVCAGLVAAAVDPSPVAC